MDYQFFEALTPEQAQVFLDEFRESQRQALEQLRPIAASEGIDLDFSLSSLANVLKWMIKDVRVHRVPVPEEEPWWIRQAHADGLTEFDDDSKTVILRAAYYLGESFARLPGLRWATGNEEFLHQRMPVISGFRFEKELPPLVVVRNMFARILADDAPETRIDKTINVWRGFCPSGAVE